jgi:hypothetical protein
LITTIEAFIKVENGHGKSVFTRLSLAEAMLFLSENFIGYKADTTNMQEDRINIKYITVLIIWTVSRFQDSLFLIQP